MVSLMYHASAVRQSVAPKLKRLWIETTDLCNSRCKTCYIWKNKESKRRLDYNVLASPIFKDVSYLLNSGGEPSLCDLKGILQTEHKLLPNATLQVSTNGLLPDRVINAVGNVLENGAKVDVGISLDGIGEIHDSFRGVKGNFEHTNYLIQTLGVLRKDYPCLKIMVGSTLTYETVKQKQTIYKYVKDNGLEFLWHWPNRSEFYHNLDSDFNGLADTSLFKEAVCDVTAPGLYRESWLKSLDNQAPCFNCYALRGFAVLRCNGDIVPCLSHWNKSIGNVLDSDALSVWNGKKAAEMRKFVKVCGGRGCLNSWGFGWSLEDNYFPLLKAGLARRLRF